MTDLSTTIAAKSDQMNADDLMGGPKTIKVRKVSKTDGEQPISIFYEGDDGKPFKPCKSMRRVLVHYWTKDGQSYVGKSMTVYRDENVRFGADAVGGIRISHLSDMLKDEPVALTVSRGQRRAYTVKPLKTSAPAATTQTGIFKTGDERKAWLSTAAEEVKNLQTIAEIENWKIVEAARLAELGDKQKVWLDQEIAAATKRINGDVDESQPADDDTFPGDLPSKQSA